MIKEGIQCYDCHNGQEVISEWAYDSYFKKVQAPDFRDAILKFETKIEKHFYTLK